MEEIKGIADGTDQSWIRHTDKPEVKVFYKYEGGFRNITMYMEKVIRGAPIINILSILAEA